MGVRNLKMHVRPDVAMRRKKIVCGHWKLPNAVSRSEHTWAILCSLGQPSLRCTKCRLWTDWTMAPDVAPTCRRSASSARPPRPVMRPDVESPDLVADEVCMVLRHAHVVNRRDVVGPKSASSSTHWPS